MFKNYLKIALRHLWKNKTFSAINIFGLAIGLAFTLLVVSYISGELKVNNNIQENDRLFLIQSKWKTPDMGYDFATLAPLAKALKDNYPGLIENYYRHDGITSIVSKDDKHFSEELQVGDESFLRITGLPLLYGNVATALGQPDAVVITTAAARKYFGKTNVVGQTLTIQSFSGTKQDFMVTGVMQNPAMNTITSWGNGINKGTNDFFLPASTLRFFGRDKGFEAWQNAFIINYVKLRPGVRPEQLQQPVEQLMKQNVAADVRNNLSIFFTPVKDYYLQSNSGLAKRMIYALGFVALFILLMAIINFINISVGNSVSRLKEIGVRKVMGGNRQQLILQFLVESTVLTAFSMLIALVLYIFTRNFFSTMLGKELMPLTDFPGIYWAFPIILTLLIGTLAGLYPAFILSRQRSVDSLKGKLETAKEKIWFRHSLIGLQFVTAIIVFVSTVFINRQVNFFLTKDLGYKKDQVITVKVPRDWTPQGVQHMTTIRNEFATLREVASASFSFEIPDGASSNTNNTLYRASQDSAHGIIAESLFTDERFASTYVIPMAAGRFFNPDGGIQDSSGVILNETAAKELGWNIPQAAIGQQLRFQGNPNVATIGGVVKDFHFGPLQEAIRPMYFIHVQNAPLFRYMSFKINTDNTAASLAAIKKKWTTLLPDAPFDYKFMDDTLAKLYSTETQIKKASEAATVIALIIVLLGVLSVVTQSITKRTKEVGIRKVLGASVLQILGLFGKEFSIVIILSNAVAWPLSWFLIHRWLMNYAYKVEVSLVPFICVGTMLAILTALIILFRTINIAFSNPVTSLRTE